jgi:hypothetical protein
LQKLSQSIISTWPLSLSLKIPNLQYEQFHQL